MPVTIDITQDIRYQQGAEQATEQMLINTSEKMFINGLDISLVQNITGLLLPKLQEIAAKVAAGKKDSRNCHG